MQLKSLEVINLRSIRKANLSFEELTVLIGSNNAGKSTILHALRLFFEASPKLSQDDFHRRAAESIEINITFENLTAGEQEEFGSAVQDGCITISRALSNDKENNLTYSVRAKTYPPFRAIRSETNKNYMRASFNALADETEGLERAASYERAVEQMAQWERENQDKLEFEFVRGFFGAPNVANGKLRKKTNLHFIPAVANVTEETSDAKRSPIINLLSDIARQTYEKKRKSRSSLKRQR